MEKKYDLSIIIPVYNGTKYLRNLTKNIYVINSDIASAIEIVLINDGSNDDSDKVCKEIVEKYNNLIGIQYIAKENGGIASARQCGIECANGKFITFMDQDDKLVKSYSSFLDLVNKDDIDVMITQPSSSEKTIVSETETVKMIEEKDNLLLHMIGLRDFSNPFEPDVPYTIWNCIFKAEIIRRHNITFHRYISYEDDAIFLMENICKSKKIGYINQSYYFWNVHDDSESHKRKCIPEFYEGFKELREWVLNFAPELNLKYNKRFNCVLKNRIVMQTIYNATEVSFKKYMEYRRLVKELLRNESVNKSDYIGTRFENLLLFLSKYRMYLAVYLLNRFVFKYRFQMFPIIIYK